MQGRFRHDTLLGQALRKAGGPAWQHKPKYAVPGQRERRITQQPSGCKCPNAAAANPSQFTFPKLEDYVPRLQLPPLPPPKAVEPEPSAYDQLTPKQKAWVDKQLANEREAKRCKVGIFEQYYQECILDRMPSAKNPIAAGDLMQSCGKSAPCDDVRNKKTGFIANTTAAECFKEHGYNVTLPIAAANIRAACYDLYPND